IDPSFVWRSASLASDAFTSLLAWSSLSWAPFNASPKSAARELSCSIRLAICCASRCLSLTESARAGAATAAAARSVTATAPTRARAVMMGADPSSCGGGRYEPVTGVAVRSRRARESSLPLDGAGRLRRDVVGHPVDAPDRVDDRVGHRLEQ